MKTKFRQVHRQLIIVYCWCHLRSS